MKSILLISFFVCTLLSVRAQKNEKPSSTKSIYIAAGTISTISSPYATLGNENGIAISGFNSGVFIGAGLTQSLSKKLQLQHFVNVNNISPFFHYKFPVDDMSYYASIGSPRSRFPAPINAAAITYQLTTSLIVPCKKRNFYLGAGAGVNYVFTRRATGEQSTLLFRTEEGTGNFKEGTYTQKINRLSFDVPIEFAVDQVFEIERLRFSLRYNWAITSRSTGSFEIDKNQGAATGNYRFIGSTVGVGFSYCLTK